MTPLSAFVGNPNGALAASGAGSAILLAGAHAFERFGGFAPCALCLDQREAHWAGLGVAIAGLALAFVFKSKRIAAAAVGAAALVYGFSAGLAFYHTGVEFKFWPGPVTCSGAGPVSLEPGALADVLNGTASTASCSDAAWTLLGISMAGYNLLFSAALLALCAFAAARAVGEARAEARPRARAERMERL
ncbi:MAG: disulfide bond formation protein B [Parvularculaceae bacterium]|nr:disulfide bond formation protein B [Parvularculaceae bacterium]